MRLDELNLKVANIDGQELYIVDMGKFDLIIKNPTIDGISIDGDTVINWLVGTMKFIKKYDEFSLGIYKRSTQMGFSWFFVVLYDFKTNLQRVHIERLTCKTCGWFGDTANPTDPSLYFGVSNRFEALNRAWEIPVVPCPKCGGKLPRNPIWTEQTI